MLKMKHNNQIGIGFLPIMIVVLMIAIAGLGYNVYENQKKLKQQAAQKVSEEEINVGASLDEVQKQLSDKLLPLLSAGNEASSEQFASSYITKDEVSGLLVQLSEENMATRISLATESPQHTALEALRLTDTTLAAYGFVHSTGISPDDDITSTTSASTVYSRGNDYCYVSGINTSFVEVGCLSFSTSDIKNKAQELQPYYDAAKLNYEADFPDETYPVDESVITINESTRKTIDNTYETVSGGAGGVSENNGFYEVIGGGRYHFYRELGGDWQISPSSGNGISSCEEFNTDVLRLLYAEYGCWDQAAESDTTVAEYWQ